MAKKIRILTTSFGTFEAVKPPFNLREPSASENRNLAQSILDSAAAYTPDMVLLPETLTSIGMGPDKIHAAAESMDGETVQMLRGCAKKGNFNVIAGLLIRENDTIYNRALVIDRKGNVAGTYDKNFPTEGEIAGGVRPSDKAACITLDCAKIGIGICFDIHWNRLWETYHNEGADLFCWISAYEGGFSIRKTAIQYRTPLVSSVMPYFARIIEINGEDAASTSRWNRIAYYDLNLDRELFHTDGQMEKIAVVQKKYGERVGVKVFHEEHLFLLENNGAGKTIQDIIDEFGLVPYDEFIKHCTEFRNNHV